MPGDKRKEQESRVPDDNELENVVHKAMKSLGWLIPLTPEEVAQAEEELRTNPVDLPEMLQDPPSLEHETRDSQTESSCEPEVIETAACLAHVAREGGTISEEVRERMNQDRARAESERDGHAEP
jgi:hypothetical protein